MCIPTGGDWKIDSVKSNYPAPATYRKKRRRLVLLLKLHSQSPKPKSSAALQEAPAPHPPSSVLHHAGPHGGGNYDIWQKHGGGHSSCSSLP